MAKVFVAQGLTEQQAFALTKSLVSLGRSANCDIVLPNPVISRKHAEIIQEGENYYLDDLNSRNGTQLNGTRVMARSLLQDGDVIQVDDVVMRFCLSNDESLNDSQTSEDDSDLNRTDHILATIDVDADLRLTENAEHKLRAIVELSRSIGLSLDIDAVLPRVLDSLLEIFPKANRASIVLSKGDLQLVPYAIKTRNPDEGESATIAPISRTVIRRVLSEQIAILSADVLADDRFNESNSVQELGIRSMICAPLMGPSRIPAGVLMADAQELRQPFDRRDLDVLVTVSSMVAQNMDYLRLHEQMIEERRHAEETLRKSNDTLQTLINSSPLALFLVDRSGRISRVWNPAAEELFGWSADEVFGQGLKMIAPEDRAKFQDHWQRVSSGRTITGAEIRCRTNRGEAIDVELSAALLPSEGPEVSDVLFIAADVTELKKTRERMLRQERLAAIGETMAGLTHESRNALNRIQLSTEILKDPRSQALDLQRIVGEIQQACDDLNYLYEDVRQFGAPIRLEKRICRLDELVNRTWESLAGVREKREATLSIRNRLEDASCRIDPVRIEQVFRNLFENSLDGCDDPVQIDVTLAPVDDGQSIRVSVRDHGPGLTPEQTTHIFDPFYTTKSSGTGLGMAIVKRNVEAHDGEICVGEPDGPGAEFVIELPRHLPASDKLHGARA